MAFIAKPKRLENILILVCFSRKQEQGCQKEKWEMGVGVLTATQNVFGSPCARLPNSSNKNILGEANLLLFALPHKKWSMISVITSSPIKQQQKNAKDTCTRHHGRYTHKRKSQISCSVPPSSAPRCGLPPSALDRLP